MPFPASAASVTTRETLDELRVAVASFLSQHPGTPVFVACPPEIAGSLPDGCTPVPEALSTVESVARRNNFHRPEAIRMKMQAMRAAFEAGHPDCLFFDADLIFLGPVREPLKDCEVCLSLNLSQMDSDMKTSVMVTGLFNAGFLWTKCPEFPNWWEHQYLNPQPNDFYEQSCLSRVHTCYIIDYFPPEHNHGWWRGPVGSRKVSSLHVHLTNGVGMSPAMLSSAAPLRLEALQRLPLPLMKDARRYLKHPRKLFFVHYHKTGGVFFRQSLTPLIRGYRLFDSWNAPHSLGRDWTQAELRAHLALSDAEGPLFLHQHAHNVTADDIVVAKENGWTLVMFYRDPRDIICSLYYFLKRRLQESGSTMNFDRVFTELPSFDDFFDEVFTMPRHWALPWWHGMVDYMRQFSPLEVSEVCLALFDAPPPDLDPKNVSENPGWQKVLNADHLARLENHPEFTRSMAWLNPYGAP